MHRNKTKLLDVASGPVWFKVTGMLAQNWAIVVDGSMSEGMGAAGASILFFDDHGHVFDSLSYPNPAQADHALAFNGYTPLNEEPGFRAIAGHPRFPLTRSDGDSRPVYSSGEYWRQPPGIERVTQRRPVTPAGLQRFVDAQAAVIETAMGELRAGRKESHWMWFVFPQISGLGRSSMARKYGIVDLDEAREYLNHPLLGPRLNECFRLVLHHQDQSVQDIFGSIDAMKFCSCATLFERAADTRHSVFELALSVFFEGKPDQLTLELI